MGAGGVTVEMGGKSDDVRGLRGVWIRVQGAGGGRAAKAGARVASAEEALAVNLRAEIAWCVCWWVVVERTTPVEAAGRTRPGQTPRMSGTGGA